MFDLLLAAVLTLPLAIVWIAGHWLARNLASQPIEIQRQRGHHLALLSSSLFSGQILLATLLVSVAADEMPLLLIVRQQLFDASFALSEVTTPWLATMAVTIGVILVAVVDGLLLSLPAMRLRRRIRGYGAAGREAGRSLRLMLAGFVPMLLWAGLYFAAMERILAYPWLLPLLLSAFLLVLYTMSPMQIAAAWPTTELPDTHPVRIMAGELCAASGTPMTDIRVLETGDSRIANAMVSGLLPNFRYLYLSDHLLDTFPDDEIRAVIAHEIGHVKHRHQARHLAFALAASPLLTLALWSLSSVVGSDWMNVLSLVLLIAYWSIGFSLMSRHFERQADRFALQATGSHDALARALRRLADVNGAPQRYARWDIFNTHPSIDARIRCISQAAPRSATDPSPTGEALPCHAE